jgi:hypothetical protein
VLKQVRAQVAVQVISQLTFPQVLAQVVPQVTAQLAPQVIWLQVGEQVISTVRYWPIPPPLPATTGTGSLGPANPSTEPAKDWANRGELPASPWAGAEGKKYNPARASRIKEQVKIERNMGPPQ